MSLADERPLYDVATFIFNRDMDRLEYAAGLQPSLWCRLPTELVNKVAEALRDSLSGALERLFNQYEEPQQDQVDTVLSLLHRAATICHDWRKLYSHLLWQTMWLHTTARVHGLEDIVSSPVFTRLDDQFQDLRLHPNDDNNPDHFFSAWRSLSRYFQVMFLLIGRTDSWRNHTPTSFPVRLRPWPRSLLHLKVLTLGAFTFPTFSALFRAVGALPSLEQLRLYQVHWKEACDPSTPPSSTATFRSIKSVYVIHCADDGWPVSWIFTTSSIGYGRLWRAPDDVEEARVSSVRADIHAIVQTIAWICDGSRAEHQSLSLRYVDVALKGSKLSSTSCIFYD